MPCLLTIKTNNIGTLRGEMAWLIAATARRALPAAGPEKDRNEDN